MPYDPPVTAETSDAALNEIAEVMWPCVDSDIDDAKSAIVHAGMAFRALLHGGMSPAQAVTTISTIALFISNESYDMVVGDGPRAILHRRGAEGRS